MLVPSRNVIPSWTPCSWARSSSRSQTPRGVAETWGRLLACPRLIGLCDAPDHNGGRDAVDGAGGSDRDRGEVEAAGVVTISRPAVAGTLAEVGLTLAEAKAFLAGLQASMVRDQLAGYAAHHRLCPGCGVPRPLKDRRTRRLQTLFGTLEVEAPRFRVCRCRSAAAPVSEAVSSPVCALLTARCTPELEQVQAELGARASFREAARILETLLPASPANHENVRNRTHAVALRIEGERRTAAAVVPAQDGPKAARSDASRPIVMLDGAYVRAG